jgi:hypothetical protein
MYKLEVIMQKKHQSMPVKSILYVILYKNNKQEEYGFRI